HKPERVNVAPRRHFLAGPLLRRHVGRRPAPDLTALHVPGERRQAEVRDAHDPDFVAEARERSLVAVRVERAELQRHRLIERQVERAIDLAHPALAEQPEDAESAGERRPGREAAFFYRWERGARNDGVAAGARPRGAVFIGHRRSISYPAGRVACTRVTR